PEKAPLARCSLGHPPTAQDYSRSKRECSPEHGDNRMSDATRLLSLRIALITVGLIFIFAIYPLGLVWPSGWTWGHGHSHYLLMIIGVYATLGVFLLLASRNPDQHRSLIW